MNIVLNSNRQILKIYNEVQYLTLCSIYMEGRLVYFTNLFISVDLN